MDQCEVREEGAPPSKRARKSQTKAQRNQPGPPPSSVSLQSDWSADCPINLKVSAAERGTKHKHAPGPSCVSCKSDQSEDRPINFKVRPVSAAERLTEVHKKMMMEEEEDRAESAGSSCPSVRSDRSKGNNPDFSAEPGPTRGQRSHSAGPSWSVRSDMSKDESPFFSAEPGATRVDQQSSEVPSGQSAQQHQTQLDSIFMLLEDNIITFVKNELKKLQKVLSPGYPESLESQREDDEQRSSREAFVKITVDFLRRMRQEEMADRLQSKNPTVCQHNHKSAP
ncbi:uncharacterized protein LOC120715245 isoform X1 [Simochromis diagramma]|uniref:uncharacterized protein LOC120715245 isoform X1 n=1 Tax=Simochromis diagramma TaxID=43689 RepID=UPI001A7EE64B|nr:uncharacterized protein LOC120715245 isoform X1 [Simochromis diagramma]